MVDTISHSVIGAIANKIIFDEKLPDKRIIVTGLIGGAFPDLDYISYLYGIEGYIKFHRLITHNIIALLTFPFILAIVSFFIFKKNLRIKTLYLAFFIPYFLHIGIDLFTSYGMKLFVPFAHITIYGDTIHFFSPFISAILLLTITLWIIFRNSGKKICSISFCLLTVFVGISFTIRTCFESELRTKLKNENVFVLPKSLSPFVWCCLIKVKDGYIRADYNEITKKFTTEKKHTRIGIEDKIKNLRDKNDKVRLFYEFARFPIVLRGEEHEDNVEEHIIFFDLRFSVDPIKSTKPFTLHIFLDRDSKVIKEWFSHR